MSTPRDIDSIHTTISQYLRDGKLYFYLARGSCRLLRRELANRAVDVFSLTGRQKSIPSIIEKLSRKSYTGISKVTDLAGVRVICPHTNSIPEVLDTVKTLFLVEKIEDTSTRDGISSFGYASWHCLVRWNPNYEGPLLSEDVPKFTYGFMENPEINKDLDNFRDELVSHVKIINQSTHKLLVEIQVRTILQHVWASISHHMLYKHEAHISEKVRRRLSRLATILEETDIAFAEEIQKAPATFSSTTISLTRRKRLLSVEYLQQYSLSVLGMNLLRKDTEQALRIARSIGLTKEFQFEELMVSTIEALEMAFSDMSLSHLRGLVIYLLAVSQWANHINIGLPKTQDQIIDRYRSHVHEEFFQSLLRSLHR